MAEIADDMTSGVACEMCGEYLECRECEDASIPMYCSIECAIDRGSSSEQVCKHNQN